MYNTHFCYVRVATEGTQTMEASDFKQALDSVYHMKLIHSKNINYRISIRPIIKIIGLEQSKRPEMTSTRGNWENKDLI